MRGEVVRGDRTPFERKVDESEPLLSDSEFEQFAHYIGKVTRADLDPEDTPDEAADHLAVLRDFCGDEPSCRAAKPATSRSTR